MIIMQIIIIRLIITAVIESLIIRAIFREYRNQVLEVDLLTKIIEEIHSGTLQY